MTKYYCRPDSFGGIVPGFEAIRSLQQCDINGALSTPGDLLLRLREICITGGFKKKLAQTIQAISMRQSKYD